MGKEKSHLSHTKRRRRGVGVGESILHCKKKNKKKTREENGKARSEEVGGHTAQDQKQI